MPTLDARHLAPAGGGYAPQFTFDFEIQFTGLGDEVALAVENAFVPEGSNEEIELNFGNEKVWVAGKALWEPGAISFKDFVDIGVRDRIIEWRQLVYNPRTGLINLPSMYKKMGYITLWSSEGSIGRAYELSGCWPTKDPTSTLDMTSSDKVLLECNIRFDRAIPKFVGG